MHYLFTTKEQRRFTYINRRNKFCRLYLWLPFTPKLSAMRYSILLIASTIFFTIASFAQDTVTLSIVYSGVVKGFDKEWKNRDGTWGAWYQFNDRGRGDSMRTIFREDEEGFPTYIKAAGKDYFKNDVFEEFSLENGIAKWKNKAEDEQKTITGKAFYSGLVSGGGHLIKAIKAHGNKLKMIPFGEAEIKVLQKHTIGSSGKEKTVYLVQTTGFGLTPNYSWIDEKDQSFAYVSDWSSSILQGYEKHIDELLLIQKKHEGKFFNNLAATLPQKGPEWMLIKDVSLFDAVQAKTIPHRDVLVHNGIIQKIGAANSIKNAAAKVIDGKGKTIMPGLWDMHVHFSQPVDGMLHMAAGVTHVRDMGSSDNLLVLMKDISEGKIIGPGIEIMSGFIDGAGPLAAPTGKLINNVEEGKKAIREFAKAGYQQIKLYSSIKPEWVKPLIDEAKVNGLRVAGHIPAFMTATQAINAGYNEVTHANMLLLNFFGDTVDTRSPLRFTLPAEKAASLDLNSDAVKEFISLLKRKNVAVDPTVGIFESMFTARDKQIDRGMLPIVDHLPLNWQRNIRAGGGGLPVSEGMDETYRRSYEVILKLTKLLYDNGIPILAGTDDLPGFSLHRELELYVQAGIPANKVLQLATLGAAQYAGKQKEYGSISVGKKADFVLVDGDPVKDISVLRKARLVVSGGKVYDPAKLYAAISIKPF